MQVILSNCIPTMTHASLINMVFFDLFQVTNFDLENLKTIVSH